MMICSDPTELKMSEPNLESSRGSQPTFSLSSASLIGRLEGAGRDGGVGED